MSTTYFLYIYREQCNYLLLQKSFLNDFKLNVFFYHTCFFRHQGIQVVMYAHFKSIWSLQGVVPLCKNFLLKFFRFILQLCLLQICFSICLSKHFYNYHSKYCTAMCFNIMPVKISILAKYFLFLFGFCNYFKCSMYIC